MRNSGIYEGFVTHQRFSPKPHGFRYQVFMMYLDLDELPKLFSGMRFWSYESKNWARFKRADYYGNPDIPLKEEITRLVCQATGHAPRGATAILLT